jgi:hypothetical protein
MAAMFVMTLRPMVFLLELGPDNGAESFLRRVVHQRRTAMTTPALTRRPKLTWIVHNWRPFGRTSWRSLVEFMAIS